MLPMKAAIQTVKSGKLSNNILEMTAYSSGGGLYEDGGLHHNPSAGQTDRDSL